MEGNNDSYDNCERHRAAHAAIAAAKAEVKIDFRLCRSHPFEEVSACHIDAPQSADDGVGHQQRLVGE